MTIQISGIDTEKVLDLYDDDTDLYAAVLRSFTENTPEVLDKLKELAASLKAGAPLSGPDEILADFAVNIHGLKGTCGTIGAEDLRKEAVEVETAAKSGDIPRLLDRNEAFLRHAYDILDNIKRWLKQIGE